MTALKTIETRASPPRLDLPAPDAGALDLILRAAMAAPDHGRMRPWRFVVIEENRRAAFADMLTASLRRRKPESSDEVLAAEGRKVFRAPLIVTIAARVLREHKVPEIEQVLAVAAAVQNMILAAHELGFAAMWKTGPAAYDPEVKRALGLQADDQIVAFLYLGTAAGMPAPRQQPGENLVTRL
jgi:nitroreductase